MNFIENSLRAGEVNVFVLHAADTCSTVALHVYDMSKEAPSQASLMIFCDHASELYCSLFI